MTSLHALLLSQAPNLGIVSKLKADVTFGKVLLAIHWQEHRQ